MTSNLFGHGNTVIDRATREAERAAKWEREFGLGSLHGALVEAERERRLIGQLEWSSVVIAAEDAIRLERERRQPGYGLLGSGWAESLLEAERQIAL